MNLLKDACPHPHTENNHDFFIIFPKLCCKTGCPLQTQRSRSGLVTDLDLFSGQNPSNSTIRHASPQHNHNTLTTFVKIVL